MDNVNEYYQEGKKNSEIDVVAIKKAAVIIRSVNHKLRQQMLTLLKEKQKLTVTEIYVQLRVEQSVASQHLAIMRRAGFVNTTRDGKNIYYSANEAKLHDLNDFIDKLLGTSTNH
jgi:DNA-binding transcriptional ArsR family regulator